MKNLIALFFIIQNLPFICQGQIQITRQYDKKTNVYSLVADNSSFEPFVVTVTFTETYNIDCRDGNQSFRKTVYPGRSIVTKIKAKDLTKSFSFGYKSNYISGCHYSKPDFDFPYLIPIKEGVKTKVKELSYLGEEYGNKPQPKGWYSLMFKTNVGDTIYAARAGVVTRIQYKNNPGQQSGLLFSRNSNSLSIYHKDCTFAHYNLFLDDGIFVKAGEKVVPGQALGLIGAENYSSGSHLRFHVSYYDPQEVGDEINYYSFVPMLFVQEDGIGNLENNSSVISIHEEDIITLEMSRRQKKKRIKKK